MKMSLRRKIVIFAVIVLVILLIFEAYYLVVHGPIADNTTQRERIEEVKAPDLLSNSVFRPYFKIKSGPVFSAGTMFATKFEGIKEPVFITALHLFGPSGGLNKDVPPEILPKFIEGVHLYNVLDEKPIGLVSRNLKMEETKPSSEFDFAAFVGTPELKVEEYSVSDALPEAGEPVWLPVINDMSKTIKLYKATVIKPYKSFLTYQFDDSKLNLRATSGGPILNKNGKVVGINLGGFVGKDSVAGFAAPCTIFKKMIKSALENDSEK